MQVLGVVGRGDDDDGGGGDDQYVGTAPTHDFHTPLPTGNALAIDVLNGIASVFVVSEPDEREARWVAGDPHLISFFCSPFFFVSPRAILGHAKREKGGGGDAT